MSRSRFASPRLRYLKARLSIFTRPSFLAAVVFLSSLGFVIKEYWTNPNFLKFSQNQQSSSPTLSNSQSSLSDEDRAIAADIDNLSILDYDKQQASIPINTKIDENEKVKQQNQTQLKKIIDLDKKTQKANEIKPSAIKPQTANIQSASQENPFLKQAHNLLQFKFDTNKKDSNVNNLSPFSANSQTPQNSFSLGITNGNFVNPSLSNNSESALQKAINQSAKNSQTKEKPAEDNLNNKETSSQLAQTGEKQTANQRLIPKPTNSLVDTRVLNQPFNNQVQNPYANFNNTQVPRNNFTQPGFNNQYQNPYTNFNNTQVPGNNFAQPGLNNQYQNPYANFNNTQVPGNTYTQPGLNNQYQTPNLNPNFNTQVPRNNLAQPNNPNNFSNNNPQQNPYSNFNRNQIPTNNRFQNPSNNFNNSQFRNNGFSPQTQTRLNNAYIRLKNRNSPTIVNPNTYNAPNNNINNINRGFQQPNVQQFNPPYSQQNQIQYPNNGFRY
ncbi:hypothetical protein Riv7116_6128 [Rivularia sp. PCC 7116]|uniref:hypothetical protein n=1 Tax=Rivularia sp. PCC 7116 TaxID=373994 RepID=UPI00029F2D4D|nr:hypothetical protein [Rivularia sp. PCC 7116]AFY58484.1 hypothetical protein Riv7116_6128 [Rivularia sp. PCC 7116]